MGFTEVNDELADIWKEAVVSQYDVTTPTPAWTEWVMPAGGYKVNNTAVRDWPLFATRHNSDIQFMKHI